MTTPLARKLGIRPGARVLLAGAPAAFAIDGLPDDVRPHRRPGAGRYDVVVLFCPDAATLHARFAPLVALLAEAGGLWACWPKRSSGIATDLSDDRVREHGLSAGLVDVKVAALDDVWSGLRFVRRRADRRT